MKAKTKFMLFGTVLAAGTLGSVTAFAGTAGANGTSTASSTKHGTASEAHGPKRFGGLEAIASALGVDKATLQSDLKQGQSIADVAKAKGVSEQTLVSNLQNALKSKLDQAVSNGKLTSQQEHDRLSGFSTHVTQLIENKGGLSDAGWKNHRAGFGGPGLKGFDFQATTSALGIDKATLKSDLQNGQSIADIAKTKGISEQTIISDLEQNLKTKLDQAVTSGKLTANQEQNILSRFSSHATDFVEHKGGQHQGASAFGGTHNDGGTKGTSTSTGSSTDVGASA